MSDRDRDADQFHGVERHVEHGRHVLTAAAGEQSLGGNRQLALELAFHLVPQGVGHFGERSAAGGERLPDRRARETGVGVDHAAAWVTLDPIVVLRLGQELRVMCGIGQGRAAFQAAGDAQRRGEQNIALAGSLKTKTE